MLPQQEAHIADFGGNKPTRRPKYSFPITRVCLTAITICDIIWGASGGGISLCLWGGYGVYKLLTNE